MTKKRERPAWQPRFVDPLVKIADQAKRTISGDEMVRWVEEAEREVNAGDPIGTTLQKVRIGGRMALCRVVSET
jgi:hypothetical protein